MDAKETFLHFGVIKLQRLANIPLGHTTVHKVLAEHDLLDQRGTTWRPYQCFGRPYPSSLGQMDITQVPLPDREIRFICLRWTTIAG